MADKLKLEILFEAIDEATKNIKNIDRSSKEMGKAVGEARDRLRDLNRQAGDMKNFVTLKKNVGDTKKEMEAAQDRVNKLAAEMRKTDNPTKAMTRDFAKAKTEAGALKDRLAAQNAELQKMRDKMASAGVSTRNFVEAEKKLREEIKKTNAEFESRKADIAARGSVNASGGGGGLGFPPIFPRVGIGAMGAGALAAVVGDQSIEAVKIAAAAESQMTSIGIKADLSRKELAKMNDEIEKMAPKVRKTATEVRDSVDFLAAAGLDARRAMKMAEPVNKASAATGADSRETAVSTYFAMKNMRISTGPNDRDLAKQTKRILDMTATAGNVGALEFKDWAKWTGSLSTQMAALGATGEKAYASMLAFGEATFMGDADQTLNNMQNLLGKLSSEEVLKNYAERGVDLRKEVLTAAKENRDIFEAVNQATIKATGGKDDEIMLLVNDMQAKNALLSMRQNWTDYQSHVGKIMNGSNGAVDKAFAKSANDTQAKWDTVVSKLESGRARLGRALQPIANFALDTVAKGMGPSSVLPYNIEMNKKAEAERSKDKARQASYNAAMKGAQRTWIAEMKAINASGGRGVGASLTEGILAGLEAKKSTIKYQLTQLALMMPQWMKMPLRINSPSKVFAGIGGGVIEGLNLGIDRDRASTLGRMSSLANDTVNSFRPSLTAPKAGSGGALQGQGASRGPQASQQGGGATYHFNITQGPGEDAEALAERVVKKLDRREGARARGAYAD
jgi:TP901 family phage tail tape measure protein